MPSRLNRSPNRSPNLSPSLNLNPSLSPNPSLRLSHSRLRQVRSTPA